MAKQKKRKTKEQERKTEQRRQQPAEYVGFLKLYEIDASATDQVLAEVMVDRLASASVGAASINNGVTTVKRTLP
jgi:hypothetical protein